MGEIKITNKNYTDGALHNHYWATRALRLELVPEYHIPIHFYIRRRSEAGQVGFDIRKEKDNDEWDSN